MLYNIYHTFSPFNGIRVDIAIDEVLVLKMVNAYLKGLGEVRHNGSPYSIGSEIFHIYEVPEEMGNDSDKIVSYFEGYANSVAHGNYYESVFSDNCKEVTQAFLKGREWGDLKEDYFNIYINDGENKPVILVLKEKEITIFLNHWSEGNNPIWISGRSIELDNPKSIKIFDINFEWLSKDRGDIKSPIKNYATLVHKGIYRIEVLEHFGKEVTDHFDVRPYGRSKPKTINFNWNLIHPEITRVAKGRFVSPHYADAVEAAFKEINDIVKKEYRKVTGNEEDGTSYA